MDFVISFIGWVGAVFLLAAYALASAERIPAGGVAFQLLNLLGAAALTANSGYHRAWPSAVLNIAWIGIGLAAVIPLLRRLAPPTEGSGHKGVKRQ